ncbi:MAG: hypothetical protein Q8R35_03470, partial [bacterium]|nr:hypothetical protein [bacterium]
TLMPFSKRYGWLGAFVFGFLAIALFDIAVGQVGVWTLVTAVAYGLVGIAAAVFFRRRESSATNYLGFSIIGTIAYDALTGLTIGPIFYAQPFLEALTGQIPFTILHLLGNVTLAVFVSPAIYRWVVVNPKLEPAVAARVPGPSRV